MTGTLSRRGGAGLCLLTIAREAHAHSSVKGIGDFYAGFLHPLTAPEHVLPFVTLGLLVGQQARHAQETVPIFSVALIIGAGAALYLPAYPIVTLVNLFSAVLFGGLVATAWTIPAPLFWGMGLLFGLTHGFANGEAVTEGIRWYLFIPGVGFAGLVVTANLMFVADYLVRREENWMRIAVRVAGSWIAAIGILVLAAGGKALLKA